MSRSSPPSASPVADTVRSVIDKARLVIAAMTTTERIGVSLMAAGIALAAGTVALRPGAPSVTTETASAQPLSGAASDGTTDETDPTRQLQSSPAGPSPAPVVAPPSTNIPPSTTAPTTTPPTSPPPPAIPAQDRQLVLVDTIGGEISPKSVVASGEGYFVAQNMMYRHTVTIYDRSLSLVATVDDTIRPAEWGYDFPADTTLRGAPVEAAFAPDGTKVYVSNYHMYGGGYGPEPSDGCGRLERDPSFVYRIDLATQAIDQVIQVGTVPKFLATSPDGSRLLVANWCSYDLSLVDTSTGTEIGRIDVGRYPRGIVFAPDGATAYVAMMGADAIEVIDVASATVRSTMALAGSPRHLVMAPDGSTLYATLNRSGEVVKIDLATETVTARLATGQAPRSMTISDAGDALFVVNYHSDTMSKVLTDSFEEVQEVPVGHHPIGITYDDDTDQVWVANYSGSIMVFHDEPTP